MEESNLSHNNQQTKQQTIMLNLKKSITALAAAAVLAPTLVACSGSNDKIVSWTNDFGGEVLVNCDRETVKFVSDDAPEKFMTPEKLASWVIKEAKRDNNSFGVIGAAMAQGIAEGAIEGACSPDVEDRLSEPNEDGVQYIQAINIERGDTGHYQDGITVTVDQAIAHHWVKAGNMFADKVVAGEGQNLIVVDLTVGNDGKTPESLMGRTFQLEDTEGNRYNAIDFDLNLTMWVNETRSNNLLSFESVNPGASRTHTLVFRVPAGVTETVFLADRNEFTFQF